nr:ABC transporter ATP-binding protein [Actinomyces sp.]
MRNLVYGLMTPRLPRLMTAESWALLRAGALTSCVVGVVNALAYLLILPLSVVLATDQPFLGLGTAAWALVLAATALVSSVVDFIGSRTSYRGALGCLGDMHAAVGNKVARLPLGWFNHDSGPSLSRTVTQEMLSLGEAVAHFLNKMYRSVLTCVTIVVGCWVWDARIGLALTLCAPLVVIGLLAIRVLISKGHRMVEPLERESAMRVVEFAQCQAALRAAGAVDRYEEMAAALEATSASRRRSLWLETLSQVLGGSFIQGCVVVMITVVTNLAVSGSMGPVETIASLGLSLSFSHELTTVMTNLIGIDDRRVLLNTVEELLEVEELPETTRPRTWVSPGTVALRKVSFSYDKATPVVQDVSFEVPTRSMCAIVGPSGSGKTTLLRLISRFYDVDDGEILLGGIDVRQVTTMDLMSQLSMVFQDVYLFDDTLEANIRLARPDASEADLAEAARLAGVDEIVERLPLGWATRVGEGGRALSGGERQRVSIARALLKHAPIVLLDEATSALDAENEQNLVASMNRLRQEATLIVVAHKLETIVSADQIVALDDDGTLAQVGTHADLLTQEGPYRRFWAKRQEASGWALVQPHQDRSTRISHD